MSHQGSRLPGLSKSWESVMQSPYRPFCKGGRLLTFPSSNWKSTKSVPLLKLPRPLLLSFQDTACMLGQVAGGEEVLLLDPGSAAGEG